MSNFLHTAVYPAGGGMPVIKGVVLITFWFLYGFGVIGGIGAATYGLGEHQPLFVVGGVVSFLLGIVSLPLGFIFSARIANKDGRLKRPDIDWAELQRLVQESEEKSVAYRLRAATQ